MTRKLRPLPKILLRVGEGTLMEDNKSSCRKKLDSSLFCSTCVLARATSYGATRGG